MNLDKDGFIGQIREGGVIEGGDSVCWNGHWLYLSPESISKPMKAYNVECGAYVRHPNKEATDMGFGAYYKHAWDGVISRDQMTGILLGVIAEKNKKAMLDIMLNWSCRGFLFAYNTRKNGKNPYFSRWKFPDLTGPDMWATALRGFGVYSWAFYPLLVVFDIHTLINTVVHNFKKESDAINFMGKLFVSLEYCPTVFSILAWHILDKDQVLDEIREYWCGWRDSHEMYALTVQRVYEITKKFY